MGRHTPGPWLAIPHYGYVETEWRIKPAPPIHGCTAGFAPHAIVRGDKRITTEQEKEANARLIAAAPELLKELTHLASLLHPWIEAGNTVPGIATLNGAWAAIAKATGETP